VLIRQLPLEVLRTDGKWPVCDAVGSAPANELLEVPAGSVTLGREKTEPLYGWDNEYGRLEKDLPAFRAAKYLVSNDEFREFMDAGGYETEKWWTEEGWSWRNFRDAKHPVFWVPAADGYRLRCLAEEIPLPGNWPAEVNYLEAKAFCNWKAEVAGRPVRLPTEEEWYRLLDVTGLAAKANGPSPGGNLNLEQWASSTPVDANLTAGFGDVMGNVWQWTETPITGFPGFEVHPLYDDFSTPTFDNRHNLIKGGSWISTGNEITRGARYAFRRHFFQHAGFRYIESEAAVDLRDDIYESDDLIAQYCEFHYGAEYYGVANFPKVTAELCLEANRKYRDGAPIASALDLGCATGRAVFELARECDHVTGIDFSARFIRVGHQMQQNGSIRFSIPEEGELVSYHEKTLDELGLAGTREKVEFWQGDAHNLKPQFTGYDLVLAANLIDRLYEPSIFLREIARRLRPGGLLVLFSPYTWLPEFTPQEKWIGGKKVDGENVTTLEGLHRELRGAFRPCGEPKDVEFVIRETKRKYQHTRSQMTVWQKKGG
jgi:putative 4-mercaptohistidine N1-methyltranferase